MCRGRSLALRNCLAAALRLQYMPAPLSHGRTGLHQVFMTAVEQGNQALVMLKAEQLRRFADGPVGISQRALNHRTFRGFHMLL